MHWNEPVSILIAMGRQYWSEVETTGEFCITAERDGLEWQKWTEIGTERRGGH